MTGAKTRAYGCRVKFTRSSGLLLHCTSLPGPYGIGDLGPQAREFADFLHAGGQKLWQVLPLHPTGYGDSPYQCFSAFAGSPLLLSLDVLRDRGLLTGADLASAPEFPLDTVDFAAAARFKMPLLARAAERFFADASRDDRTAFENFRQSAPWLEDFALFMALKDAHQGAAWTRWAPALRDRDPRALSEFARSRPAQLDAIRFWQFEFFREWEELKSVCQSRSVRFMGDIPIYVAHDSADVWARPDLFLLDALGQPTVVSGVPPDYFSATGQLWGNPIYRWERLQNDGFAWWISRFRSALALFDLVRLDHFRGFESYWEVPGDETTAIHGRWIHAPGEALLSALEKEFGELPIVAENLGVITPPVENLRHKFNLPGMSILQFAFGADPQAPGFRPHNYTRDLVAYTGSHDNDTAQGWWTSSGGADSTRTPEQVRKEHAVASAYLNLTDESQIHWAMIRAVFGSVADTVIVPVQDILGLGSAARMNLPGTVSGNWKWRCRPGVLDARLAARLRELAVLYDR
ncbi:MAG: 4-alpha-glucanotransferase [Terracidiphilus sp.]